MSVVHYNVQVDESRAEEFSSLSYALTKLSKKGCSSKTRVREWYCPTSSSFMKGARNIVMAMFSAAFMCVSMPGATMTTACSFCPHARWVSTTLQGGQETKQHVSSYATRLKRFSINIPHVQQSPVLCLTPWPSVQLLPAHCISCYNFQSMCKFITCPHLTINQS